MDHSAATAEQVMPHIEHVRAADGEDWSVEQWRAWIAEQQNKRALIFSTDPVELLAAYHREIAYTSDYHGRELLELLQNADDAGGGESQPVKVIIVLTEEGLCVANTGTPFSANGLKSLMVSDASPKHLDRARFIGNRGLGFRSVLNWTDCPFVVSGNLAVGFDRLRAKRWLQYLCMKDDKIQARVEEVRASDPLVWPVPTLAVPSALDADGTADGERPDANGFDMLWSVARELRSNGFDTVIAMPFGRPDEFAPDAAADVLKQLVHVGRDVLLFTRHLWKLEIVTDEGNSTWSVERADNLLELIQQDGTRELWQLFTAQGSIPEELLRPELRTTREYEIKLAIPRDGAADLPDVLFNYFPTQVAFPYPLIAHVTMELTNNRQHLVQSGINRYLAGKLAERLAEAAATCDDASDPWQPLSFVTARGAIDTVLEVLGFSGKLREAARQRPIIPTRGGQLMTPMQARRLEKEVTAAWLPAEGFEDLALWPQDWWLRRSIANLGVRTLTQDELRCRLNTISPKLTTQARAILIHGLISDDLMPTDPTPDLLIDEGGMIIPSNRPVFLPRADGKAYQLPPWMNLTVLSGHLFSSLRATFDVSAGRSLVAQLSAFQIHEYALLPLVVAINAEATRQVNAHPDRERAYRVEALQAIHQLYMVSDTADRTVSSQGVAHVPIPTRSGHIAPATSLYFGQEYSRGLLTEALYGTVAPDAIVAAPRDIGLEASDHDLADFLAWLGVADQPRDSVARVPTPWVRAFTQYVKEHLRYPAQFSPDTVIREPDGLSGTYLDLRVTVIDQLDDLLERADPHAILAWVALDSRLEQWRSSGDQEAQVRVRLPGKRNERWLTGQRIPSYVLWRIATSGWLPTTSGDKRPPEQCIMASHLSEVLYALLPRPLLQNDHDIFRGLGVDKPKIRAAFERVGVRPDLDDLTWDDVYALLLELPQRDPSGAAARAFYRALIGRADHDSPTGRNRERFLREGRLWGICGEHEDYYDIAKLKYVDTAGLPDVVLRELPLLALEPRRGAQKVTRLFSVDALDERSMKLCVEEWEENSRAGELDDEVQALKPLILAMRLGFNADFRGITRLRSLTVRLCQWVRGRATIGDKEIDINLRAPADSIVDVDANTAYLAAAPDDSERVLADSLVAQAIGDIFAEIMQVDRASYFAQLAMCLPARRPALLKKILRVSTRRVASLTSTTRG